jgi:hypothetical protein
VLSLARSSRDVTLVYTTDEASEEQDVQIPESLEVSVFCGLKWADLFQTFVHQDNRALEEEMAEYRRQWHEQSGWDNNGDQDDGRHDGVPRGPPPAYDADEVGQGNGDDGGVRLSAVAYDNTRDEAIFMDLDDGDAPSLSDSTVSDLSMASVRTVVPAPAAPTDAASEGELRQKTAEAALAALRATDAAAALQAAQQGPASSRATTPRPAPGWAAPAAVVADRAVPPPLPPRDGQAGAQTGKAPVVEGDGKDAKKGRSLWKRPRLAKKGQ